MKKTDQARLAYRIMSTTLALVIILLYAPSHSAIGANLKGGSPILEDHNDLKGYIARSIKYPASAKKGNISGYIIVKFEVNQKKISNISFTKKLHPDLENEVLNAITSFNQELEMPNDAYELAIVFVPEGKQKEATELQQAHLSGNHFLGHVMVIIKENGDTENIWTSTPNPGGDNYADQDNNLVRDFSRVDSLPEFQGGLNAWLEYLKTNIQYPEQAIAKNLSGRVILKFVVDKDGTLDDVEVIRGIEKSLDDEAIRLLKTSPNWKPGVQNGRTVKVSYTLPVFFQLGPDPDLLVDFNKVEVKPEFPGGDKSLGMFLVKNLQYPAEARRQSINGNVIVGFIIEKDGSLSNIRLLKGIGGGADQESLRVIKLLPNWKPGTQNGLPVRVEHSMPISFQMTVERSVRF